MKFSEQDQNDVEGEVAGSALSALTESIVDPQSAMKVLAITVTAEIGALLMFYFSKGQVLEFLRSGNNAWLYACVGLFLVGFLTCYATFRLLPRMVRRRFFTYTVWAIAVAAGLANIALFYVLLNFRIG